MGQARRAKTVSCLPANPSLGRASVQRSFGAIRLRRLRQASTATHTLHLPTIELLWRQRGLSDAKHLTPALADTKKRPVLVWIHGGGFTNGNSIEQDSYRGENLSRYGDIVFVSLNHRLGPYRLQYFSGVDEKKFAESGNVGIPDLVAGLKWVHNNIAQFGGDPSNVTIMGQSGGGAKVCTLVAMVETKGCCTRP